MLHAELTSPPMTNPPYTPPPMTNPPYTPPPMTNPPYTPPPGNLWAPSQDGSFGSSSSSFAGENNPDAGGGRADFSSSDDGSGSRWQASGSGDAGWAPPGSSQGSASPSSSGSGWRNAVGAGWDGLWNFKGGWNWDSPYPPAGITLETDIDGEIALMPRRKVFFNPSRGFSASHDLPRNKCAHRFCLNVTISSNYGAMSAFDAFVMDRYESKSELGSDAFAEGGPVPMVNGMMSDSELLVVHNGNANESATSKYNHTRKTSWMLYPLFNDSDEIDIVMSFKQLYTLLPDYNDTDASSDGPFYSDDPNDQVILRLTARLASPYASSTAILPQVFESKGSRLFDVDFTSSIAYGGEESYSSNQIDLDLVFSRKGYGGFIPWMPAQLSSECQQCDAQMMGSSSVFEDCLNAHMNDSVFSDLLSPNNNITSFDLQETRDDCFGRLMSADFSASAISSSSSSSSSSLASSSAASQESEFAGYDPLARRLIAISRADAGIRCYINSQCPIGDNLYFPSDGDMVVFACEKAAVRTTFFEPEFEFQLELTVLNETGLLTLEIASDDSEEKIAQIVKRAIPMEDQDHLNVTVHVFNNSMEIYYANQWNEWLMSQYMRELKLSKSSGSSSSGSSESAGTAGSSSSVSSDWSAGFEGSEGSTMGGPTAFGGPSSDSSQGGPPPPQQRRFSDAVTPPLLYDVPSPNFIVEITFNNVSVVPNVTNVISSQNVQWEYTPMALGFKLAPLSMSKFTYVPPPPQLDLGSDPADQSGSGGSWNNSNSSSLVNLFGSCRECADEYTICAADEDCRFGVRTSLYQALQRKNFPSQDSSIDISWVLRNAFMFFSAGGMGKFSAFVSCLATRTPLCNIDVPRMESNPVSGTFEQGPATYLRIDPTVVTMAIEKGSAFYISSAGRIFKYFENGNPDALRAFLTTNLATNNIIPTVSVDVNTSQGDGTRNFYTMKFSNLLLEAPYFSNPNTTTDIMHSLWRLWIDGPTYRTIDWQMLLGWLHPLAFDPPRDTAPGGGDSNQPVPSNPSAICSECMDKLSKCLNDYECENSVREFLKTQLKVLVPAEMQAPQPPTINVPIAGILDSWKTRTTSNAYGKFVDLLNCLAVKSCAVGYNPSAPTKVQVPTTFSASSNVGITVESGSPIKLSYMGSTHVFTENGSALDFEQFLKREVFPNGTYVYAYSFTTVENKIQYVIHVDQLISDLLSITTTATVQVVTQDTIAMFTSTNFTPPTWRNLLQWFGVTPRLDDTSSGMTTTPDVCTQCLPDIMDCMADPVCSAAVRDHLVPSLRGHQVGASINNYIDAIFDGFSTTFRLRVMSMLSPMANLPAFTTSPSSWNMLSRALMCFANRPCDLKYTSAATAAPATAHAPTYLQYLKAMKEVVLLKGTTLSVSFQGEVSSFVQSDDLSAFEPWLKQLVGGRMILNFPNATKKSDTGEFQYVLEIEGYVGTPPVLSVVSVDDGLVRPTVMSIQEMDMWFESVNQLPDWQKLIDFLSLTPSSPDTNSSTATASPSSSNFQCPMCATVLNNCYNDTACQMALSTFAIPSFRSTIHSSPPTTDGRFEDDFATQMTMNVLFALEGNVQSTGLLMDVFKCSASSPCPDASSALSFPASHANLILEHPTSNFSIPSGAQMMIYFQGATYSFQDNNDTGPLKTFLEDTVLMNRDVHVEIQRYSKDATTMLYHIVYQDFYSLTAPHFSWQGPTAADAPQGMGVESPWRFVFSSTEPDIYASFKWWIDWLATNGNPVTTST